MPFLYHLKPANMRGDTLYPLNALRHTHPDLYAQQRAKYDDHPNRRRLPGRVVPILNCFWNDVLHFSPAHPHLVYRAWLELGKPVGDVAFYRIPVARVARLPGVIYKSSGERSSPDVTLAEDSVSPFDPDTFEELKVLPEATHQWYAKLYRQGKFGAFFAHVPHVLIRGPVRVNEADLVLWSEPPADLGGNGAAEF